MISTGAVVVTFPLYRALLEEVGATEPKGVAALAAGLTAGVAQSQFGRFNTLMKVVATGKNERVGDIYNRLPRAMGARVVEGAVFWPLCIAFSSMIRDKATERYGDDQIHLINGVSGLAGGGLAAVVTHPIALVAKSQLNTKAELGSVTQLFTSGGLGRYMAKMSLFGSVVVLLNTAIYDFLKRR